MTSNSIPIDDFATLSPPSPPSIAVDNVTCQVCHQSPSKYKCPRCDVRSCSVICVKQHKTDQSCSGERSKTHYVAMKEYSESNMMSDYVYLEDVSRQSDTLTRHRIKDDKAPGPADYKLRMVIKRAREMGVLYDMLPSGMSRRKVNRTNYSTKLKQIFWTLEFCFCLDDSQERVMEHSCPSNKSLRGVFQNMLLSEKPYGQNTYATIRHQLRHFVDADMKDWVVGLKKEGGKRNHYINLTSHLDETLAESLKGERVIEYPTIYIWLRDHVDSSIQLEDKCITLESQPENDKTANDNDNNDNDDDDDDDSSDDDESSDDDSGSDTISNEEEDEDNEDEGGKRLDNGLQQDDGEQNDSKDNNITIVEGSPHLGNS